MHVRHACAGTICDRVGKWCVRAHTRERNERCVCVLCGGSAHLRPVVAAHERVRWGMYSSFPLGGDPYRVSRSGGGQDLDDAIDLDGLALHHELGPINKPHLPAQNRSQKKILGSFGSVPHLQFCST